ncbi:MAG: PilZ domain-containing protein [Candidatus Omnitrophica bacterium]|nr:PilZ domain-containing protein [Candidatus Omnitrophota bacterium]
MGISREVRERRSSNRKTGSDEKRNYIRADVSVPIIIYVKKKNGPEKVNARAWNISASGMMVEAGDNFDTGIKVGIEITTPGSPNPVHCKGRIVWASEGKIGKNGYSYGVEFISIEEDNKNTFLKFLCDLIYKNSQTL